MLRNQVILDELFDKASTAADDAISQIDTAASRDFVGDELRFILTTLSERLGAQMEILKIFRSEIEAVMEPS